MGLIRILYPTRGINLSSERMFLDVVCREIEGGVGLLVSSEKGSGIVSASKMIETLNLDSKTKLEYYVQDAEASAFRRVHLEINAPQDVALTQIYWPQENPTPIYGGIPTQNELSAYMRVNDGISVVASNLNCEIYFRGLVDERRGAFEIKRGTNIETQRLFLDQRDYPLPGIAHFSALLIGDGIEYTAVFKEGTKIDKILF